MKGAFIKGKKPRYNREPDTRVNGAIRASELRVIDADGSQAGVLSRDAALELARSHELDLVEVSPGAKPPVAKVVDWGKYNYQKTKSKKKQKTSDLKQIRMGLKIGDHDLEIKVRKIREFLEEGHKVRVTAFFRGREMAHKDIGYELLKRVNEKLEDIAVVDQNPIMTGKHLSQTVIRSSKSAKNEDA